MRVETVEIGTAKLEVMLPNPTTEGIRRPLAIVCPGGGFVGCANNEGEPVALRFMDNGYVGAVLTYSTVHTAPGADATFPTNTRELAQAVVICREHAEEWGIDPDRVCVVGFSAGGHVASSLCTMWNDEGVCGGIGTAEQRRPNAAVLGYPLADLTGWTLTQEDLDALPKGDLSRLDLGGDLVAQGITPEEMAVVMGKFKELSCQALIGHCPATPEEVAAANPLAHVGAHVCPTFLWTTFTDDTVDPFGDLRYATALREAGVRCELHVFEKGSHGLSLSTPAVAGEGRADAHVALWPLVAIDWLDRIFER